MELTPRGIHRTGYTDIMQELEYHRLDQGQAGRPHPRQKKNKATSLLSPPALAPEGLGPRGEGTEVSQASPTDEGAERGKGGPWPLPQEGSTKTAHGPQL